MPRPHGITARIFAHNSRAIALEAEWMVMTQRIANELRPLVKLANDQGWKIEAAKDGTKLAWRGPNGEGPVFTGYRCQGRDLLNYRAELVRAGLRLDEAQAKIHTDETQVTRMMEKAEANPMSQEELTALLDTVMSQLSTMNAKAALFDKARQDAKDWQGIAEDAQDAAEAAIKRLEEYNTMIAAIRECFNLAPWAVLGEIARLLDIDMSPGAPNGGPTIPATKKASNA